MIKTYNKILDSNAKKNCRKSNDQKSTGTTSKSSEELNITLGGINNLYPTQFLNWTKGINIVNRGYLLFSPLILYPVLTLFLLSYPSNEQISSIMYFVFG